jgi:hypothetical protein
MLQHGVLSAINETKKQILSPGFAWPIVVVTVVDWPFGNAEPRFVSCGVNVKVLPCPGVSKICDIGLPELFLTLNV